MKRRKVVSARPRPAELYETLFRQHNAPSSVPTVGPNRRHALAYHRPLLLHGDAGKSGRDALLAWFDSKSTARKMPWRKPWLDPANTPRETLERRAYEVWISEIMLQQTRVAVVIDYWNRWMDKWPTIHDLAAAEADEVLSAWRGLGYYSRARRIHEAAGVVVGDKVWKGLLPSDTKELESRVPGVGPYTAGAIASIVFGRAVPMVDGNVLRVLSRQLGIYGNVKTDKAVIDLMWAAADALVKAAAADHAAEDGDPGAERVSDVPGRWGQALMELGSTLCTPKPDCGACPVSATCHAYNEGLARAREPAGMNGGALKDELGDIEDACTLCEPFEEVDDDEEPPRGGKRVNQSAKNGATRMKEESPPVDGKSNGVASPAELSVAIEHARRFPLKVIKKAVREEETVVCAIRRADGRFLLHRRPEKGLLAGLWEMPSHTLPSADSGKPAKRKGAAVGYLDRLYKAEHAGMGEAPRHVRDLGAVPWLFSHLKLTMHVHLFTVSGGDEGAKGCTDDGGVWRWADSEEVEGESMGTGMRKCWALVKEASEDC